MATQSAIENISPNFLFPFSPKTSSLKRCEKIQKKVSPAESAKYSPSKMTLSPTKGIANTNNLFVERRTKMEPSNKLITKDISNYKIKDKENLIKIHRSMNLIIDNLSNEIDKIDQMKLYDLNFNVRDNLTKLKVNLIKLKDMCNNIYQKYE